MDWHVFAQVIGTVFVFMTFDRHMTRIANKLDTLIAVSRQIAAAQKDAD